MNKFLSYFPGDTPVVVLNKYGETIVFQKGAPSTARSPRLGEIRGWLIRKMQHVHVDLGRDSLVDRIVMGMTPLMPTDQRYLVPYVYNQINGEAIVTHIPHPLLYELGCYENFFSYNFSWILKTSLTTEVLQQDEVRYVYDRKSKAYVYNGGGTNVVTVQKKKRRSGVVYICKNATGIVIVITGFPSFKFYLNEECGILNKYNFVWTNVSNSFLRNLYNNNITPTRLNEYCFAHRPDSARLDRWLRSPHISDCWPLEHVFGQHEMVMMYHGDWALHLNHGVILLCGVVRDKVYHKVPNCVRTVEICELVGVKNAPLLYCRFVHKMVNIKALHDAVCYVMTKSLQSDMSVNAYHCTHWVHRKITPTDTMGFGDYPLVTKLFHPSDVCFKFDPMDPFPTDFSFAFRVTKFEHCSMVKNDLSSKAYALRNKLILSTEFKCTQNILCRILPIMHHQMFVIDTCEVRNLLMFEVKRMRRVVPKPTPVGELQYWE